MSKLIILLFSLFIFISTLVGMGETRTPTNYNIQSQIVDTYVQVITTEQGFGSGIAIKVDNEDLILTCYHVVDKAKNLYITKFNKDKKMLMGQLVTNKYYNKTLDLALLKYTRSYQIKPAQLYNGEPRIGSLCYSIGTPAGIHALLDQSLISNTTYTIQEETRFFYLINGCGWYGSSGGGVFCLQDNQYKLVGVTCRMVQTMPRGPMVVETNKTIHNFIEEYKRECSRTTSK